MTSARAVRTLAIGLALAQAGAAAAQPPPGAVPGPPPSSSPSTDAPTSSAPAPDTAAPAAVTPSPAATAEAPEESSAPAPAPATPPADAAVASRAAPGMGSGPIDASSRPRGRAGFFGGVGAGGGVMGLACGPSCEGLDASATLSAHAGLLLASGLVVLYDAALLVHLDESPLGPVRVYHSTHLLALQGWMAPRVWVRGGPGLAHLRVHHVGIGTRGEMVPALGGALGVELWRAAPTVIEGVLRVSAGFFDEDDGQDDAVYTLSIGAGASWY